MTYFKIIFATVRLCQNWPELLLHRIAVKLGWKFLVRPVRQIYMRNGVIFTTGTRQALGASDLFLIWEIWMKRCYFIVNRDDFRIRPEDAVIDIGANKGYFTVFAARMANLVIIYSFEPVPDNYNLLAENVRLNGLLNVVTEQSAVAHEAGGMTLRLSETNEGGHGQFLPGGKVLTVSTINLESYCGEKNITRINFLKVDCEGGEYGIVLNLSQEFLRKIEKISMEHHKIPGRDPQVLVDFLRNNNFEILEFNSLYLKAINKSFTS